jgi:hypothetical protein
MTKLIVAFRNFADAAKNCLVTNINIKIIETSLLGAEISLHPFYSLTEFRDKHR